MSQVKTLTYIMNQLNNLEANEDNLKNVKVINNGGDY